MEIKISIYANFLSQYFQGQLPLSKMADGKQVAGYLKEGSFPSFTVFPWKEHADAQNGPKKLLWTIIIPYAH